jgi:hypothetical protein
MIKSFQVQNASPEEFIRKITDALSGRELGKIASMSLSGNNIVVTFSKLGKTEVIFSLTKESDKFTCNHQSEKVALTHRALRGDIESKLAKVLESVGANVVQG